MDKQLNIEYVEISIIKPYNNNPRKNDKAVEVVKKSIKEYGFKIPIIIDENNIIIAGHTRLKAAQSLGIKRIPVIKVNDLSPEQVKAFRIMDNKTNDYSVWDYDLLKEEIIDLKELGLNIEDLTGFKPEEITFLLQNENEKNNAYLEWRDSGNIDFDNQNLTGYKTIIIHFPDKKNMDAFSELIKQKVTERTRFIWFPEQPKDNEKEREYVEE